jgi:hypothetical protein
MTLAPRTRLAPFETFWLLGASGTGEACGDRDRELAGDGARRVSRAEPTRRRVMRCQPWH